MVSPLRKATEIGAKDELLRRGRKNFRLIAAAWVPGSPHPGNWRFLTAALRALFFLFATFFAFYLRQFNPLTPTPSDRPIDSACDNETGASFRPGREPVQTGTIVPVENR